MATVKREIYQYTESVYYDDDGVEVYRERNWDDHWYDTESVEEISAEELEDYL